MDFPDQSLEITGGEQQQERAKQQAAVEQESMSVDEMHDILYRYDGFEELLAPMADNLKKFSPEADKKKRRFLQDDGLVEERQELRDSLAAYLSIIENQDSHKKVRSAAQAKLDSNEELINENLDAILKKSRDLERTYRELETFFRNAGAQKVKNLTLLNVNADTLIDADSNLIYKVINKLILDQARSVDQRKAYSMLVMPGLWRSERPKDLIERYTKLVGDARMSFLTDFEDCDSVEEVIEETEGKRWRGFGGSELHHSKLIMFANHMILRGKHKDLKNDEDIRGSVAMAVAGKMYAEAIAQPIMGEKHGALSESQGLAFRTVQDEVSDIAKLGINSTMPAYDKDLVYAADTAFNGKETILKRYSVVRTFDYVNRVLRHFLGKVTGQALTRTDSNTTRDTVQEFLDDLKIQGIIREGRVKKWGWNAKVPDRIDLEVHIEPMWAVRTFVYSIKAAKNEQSSSELKEVN